MIFLIIFFVQVVSISLCFDVELEGAVHFGNDLMRRLGNEILPLELKALEPTQPPEPRRPAVQLMTADPNLVQRAIVERNVKELADKLGSNGKEPENNGMVKVNQTYEMITSPTESPKKAAVPDDKFRIHLKYQLLKNGSLRLKMLAYFIRNSLNRYTDISIILRNSTYDYLVVMDKYFDFISKKPIKYDIDKELVVLDMIESANNILMNEAKKLLDAIIVETEAKKSEIDTQTIMEKIKNTVLEEKKGELQYVCKILNICRPFPGYSEHFADLLSELLQLNDNSLKILIKNLHDTITLKRHFFKTIMRENVLNKISSKLINSLYDTAFIREVFSILRSGITQRYKIFKSDSLIVKIKTKAVRILLDLVDKAFDVNDDDSNFKEIENTVNSYKQWAMGDRHDVDTITKNFLYKAVEILNDIWGRSTKEEVKVLMDVIFTGATQNRVVYDHLFTQGSKLLQDEEIHELLE